MINKELAVSKGLTPERIIAIEQVNELLQAHLARPEMFLPDDKVATVISAFEYTLQALWMFDPDSSKHSYWNKVKGCSCPKLDNDELWGTGLRRVDRGCRFHGCDIKKGNKPLLKA